MRGELGWWRMVTRRDYKKLSYWINILLMEDTRLVKKVYRYSKDQYLRKHKNNWTKTIHKLSKKFLLTDLWENESNVYNTPQEDQSQPRSNH